MNHVIPVLDRLRQYRSQQPLPLREPVEFLRHFEGHLGDCGAWLSSSIFKNRQRTSTVNGILKGYAVQQILEILDVAGIQTPADLLAEVENTALRSKLMSVAGDPIGVRTDYLYMLAGCTELTKFDRQLQRFLSLPGTEHGRLTGLGIITAVTELLRVSFPCINVRSVDHFIWEEMSDSKDGFEPASQERSTEVLGRHASSGPMRAYPHSPSSVGDIRVRAPCENQGKRICHQCYLSGLEAFVAISRARGLRESSWKQYQSDGLRFSTAYRNGEVRVLGTIQTLPRLDCLSQADFEGFQQALVNGGMGRGATEAYRTPVRGAFDESKDCTHCCRGGLEG
jgi:hypothetical protein